MKALTDVPDDKLNVTQNIKYVFNKAENIKGKGENAGKQQCLLLTQIAQKAFSSGA